MKKLLALVLCLCMVVGVSVPVAFASENDTPTPYWVQTERVDVGIDFLSGKAMVTGDITGKSGTTKIVATFTLEKKNANGVYA